MSGSFSFELSAGGLHEISQDAVSPKEVQEDIDDETNALSGELELSGDALPTANEEHEMDVDQEFDTRILTDSLRKASAQVVVQNTLKEYQR